MPNSTKAPDDTDKPSFCAGCGREIELGETYHFNNGRKFHPICAPAHAGEEIERGDPVYKDGIVWRRVRP